MRIVVPLLMVASLATACAAIPPASEGDRVLAFGCADVVLIGRIKNGDFEPVNDKDDILGHGWFNAEVEVQRVVKGTGVPPRVPVRYFAHTYIRSDRDFMLVLHRGENGAYVIEALHLMSVRPRLATRCE
jgi:hypothetical protein